jgi:predicted outer membrane repeat protein
MKTIQLFPYFSNSFSKAFLLFCFFTLLGNFAVQAQTIRYVKHDATGANNGTSWANAYTDLQTALNAATVGNEIWVAAGTYKPTQMPTGTTDTDPRLQTFYLNKNIKVYGGFAGTETARSQRDYVLNVTTLSGDIGTVGMAGDNCYHVFITKDLTTSAVIDGFTIKDGNSSSSTASTLTYGSTVFNHFEGGGMNHNNSSPTLANLYFTDNSVSNSIFTTLPASGGGMYSSGSPLLTNVTFHNNYAAVYGGGMYSSGSPVLTNVTFTNNSAAQMGGNSGGGGIYCGGGSPTFINVSFSNNSAGNGYGGAMYNSYTTPTLTNVSFTNNFSTSGAIHNYFSSPTLINVTIYDNSVGLYNEGNSSPVVRNSIIWRYGGGPGDPSVVNGGMGTTQPTFYYSLIGRSNAVVTGDTWNPAYGIDGGFNIDCDPLFVSNTNLSLRIGSPAIANGNDGYNSTTTDLAGNARILDDRIDMGAYEFVCTPITPIVSLTSNDADNNIVAGTSVTFTAEQTNRIQPSSCPFIISSPIQEIYQWRKNGNPVGNGDFTYTDANLANGDVISVEVSNFMCATMVTGTSNAITMTVTSCSPTVTPAVTIASNDADNNISTGTSVTFTATPTNGGTTPTYQWKKNGNNVGTNSATYTDAGLLNGNVISVVMTSNAVCASPTTATSNAITMVVTSCSPVTPAVTIASNDADNNISAGTSVTFTATPTNGGTSPTYQWKKNGNNVGTNSATYTDAGLLNGDVIRVVMTSNAACASPTTATSNAVTMVVNTPTQLYQLKVTDVVCGGTQPATLHLNMNMTRSCMDALMVKIQFDSTKVFFENNMVIQKGTAVDTSGRVFYSFRQDTLFITVDLETGCIRGDSGANVLRIPVHLRPTFALAGATSAFNLTVLEERITANATQAQFNQAFEVLGTLLGKVQVFRPNGNLITGTTNPITIFMGDTCSLLNRSMVADSNAISFARLDSFRYFRLYRSAPAFVASPLIGGYDVFLLRNNLHGGIVFTPRQKLAADVNNDGVISTLDVTILRRRAVGIYMTFAEASNGRLTSDYQFTQQDVDTPQTCFRLPIRSTTCDTPNIQIKMITLGDINGDTDTTSILGGIRGNGTNSTAKNSNKLMVQLCRATRVGNEWKIPVFANTVTRGLDLQLLNIPELGVLRVESANPTAFEVSANGNNVGQNYYIIGFSNSIQGIPANDTLLYLYVRTANAPLSYLGTLNGYLDAQSVSTEKVICTQTDDIDTYAFQIYPNPTVGNVEMKTEQPLSENTTLRVYDMLGRNVKTVVLQQGNSNFTIDMSNLANGVYQFHFANQYKKMIKQ